MLGGCGASQRWVHWETVRQQTTALSGEGPRFSGRTFYSKANPHTRSLLHILVPSLPASPDGDAARDPPWRLNQKWGCAVWDFWFLKTSHINLFSINHPAPGISFKSAKFSTCWLAVLTPKTPAHLFHFCLHRLAPLLPAPVPALPGAATGMTTAAPCFLLVSSVLFPVASPRCPRLPSGLPPRLSFLLGLMAIEQTPQPPYLLLSP